MTRYDYAAAQRLQDPAEWAQAGIGDPDLAEAWWTAGFDPTDAQEWLELGRACFEYEAEPWRSDQSAFLRLAAAFKTAGFAVEEARTWAEAVPLVRNEDVLDIPHEARRWGAAGFTPETASAVVHPCDVDGFDSLKLAVAFLNAGWDNYAWTFLGLLSVGPHHGDEWEARCLAWVALDSPRTLDYVKAGVSPQEAQAFEALGLQPEALDIELRARYARREPIDDCYAMRFNHLMFICRGDDERDDLPFHAEFLPTEQEAEQQRLMEEAEREEEAEARAVEAKRREAAAELGRAEAASKMDAMLGPDGFCLGSGRVPAMDEVPDSDEWYVRCRTCDMTTAGGSAAALPDHLPVGYRPKQ